MVKQRRKFMLNKELTIHQYAKPPQERRTQTPSSACESISIEAVAQEWLLSRKSIIKVSTYNKYRNLIQSYIVPQIGNLPVAQLSDTCAEQLCEFLLLHGGAHSAGLSPKTVSDTLSVLRNILEFSIRRGYLREGRQLHVLVRRQTRELRVFSLIEQEKLCSYLAQNLNRKNVGILLCLFTGMRIGELCALRWSDISLKEQSIHVHLTMQRIQTPDSVTKTKVIITTPKSSCSIRTIPIPEELAKLLVRYQGQGFVLTGSETDYIEPRTMQNHFRRILVQCEIKQANFHSLRHTFATRCIEMGFDLKSLSEILGHANVNITLNRYVHPSMDLKRKNMQRLSKLITVE